MLVRLIISLVIGATSAFVDASDYCFDAMNLQLTLLSSEYDTMGVVVETNTLGNHKLDIMFSFFFKYPEKRKFHYDLIDVIENNEAFDWDALECYAVKTNPGITVL